MTVNDDKVCKALDCLADDATGHSQQHTVAFSGQQQNANHTSLGAYSDASLLKLNLSHDQWQHEQKEQENKLWRDSPQGRLAMRCFSRGILGAAFFVAGGRYQQSRMSSYNPNKSPENFPQFIAKIFDTFAGKPIKFTVNMLGGDGHRAVTFRPTRKFGGYNNWPGRSLGHEAVAVTFDFASMSVGDAMGRDIAGIFDPNSKLTWMKDGHIDYPQGVRSLALSAFRYLTYNQGEDWAVALPYIYYLRAQRNVINKFSPGFMYDSDKSRNGGSFKVNDQGQIVGNYNAEGALDLQGRFVTYNIGTLMFREAYVEVAHRLHELQHLKDVRKEGVEIPQPELAKDEGPHGIVDTAKHIARWAARDIIKGSIYMTPSVPFFWMTRTSQAKSEGIFIHPEKGVIEYATKKHQGYDFVHMHESYSRHNKSIKDPQWKFTRDTPTFFGKFNEKTWTWSGKLDTVHNPHKWSTETKPWVKPFDQSFGQVDSVLNNLGWMNHKVRKATRPYVYKAAKMIGVDAEKQNWVNNFGAFVNASISYTPYFYTKTEFARLWDNAKMDQSIERALDGIGSFDSAEMSQGLNDMWRTFTFQPLKQADWEAKAQKRIEEDVTPADVFDPKLFQPAEGPQRGSSGFNPLGRRKTFAEKLEVQKEIAKSRLENLKKPESFAAQIAQEKKPEEPARDPQASHAEAENARQTTNPSGPTLH